MKDTWEYFTVLVILAVSNLMKKVGLFRYITETRAFLLQKFLGLLN